MNNKYKKNNRYKKVIATGLASNMVLMNVPYNVFANSDIIEEVVLGSDNISLNDNEDIKLKNNESDKVESINQKDFINDEDIINKEEIIYKDLSVNNIKEGVSNYINSSTPNNINEDISNLVEINEADSLTSKINDSQENKKASKSVSSVTNYANSFAGGDGSEENPYQISNAMELARLAYLVNDEGLDTAGMYFELTSDIDLSTFDSDDNLNNGNWTPIGYSESVAPYTRYYFKGMFNGNNYTISNIDIDATLQSVGLFGYTLNTNIKNINLSNVSVVGGDNISALIGYAGDGTILSNVNVTINHMNTCSSNTVYVGGLVGYSFGENHNLIIDNCTVTFNNKISINKSLLGGFIGSHRGGISVSNSCVKGELDSTSKVGGIIADYNNSDKVEDVVEFRDIDIELNIAVGDSSVNGGGLAGFFYYPGNSNSIDISNINFKGGLSGGKNSHIGGLFGTLSTSDSNTADVNIFNCNIELMDLKGSNIGGVVGNITGLAKNKYKFKDLAVWMKGDIYSINEMGGIVGSSHGDLIVDSFDLIIENPVVTNGYVGGIVGWLDSSLIINNINTRFNVTPKKGENTYEHQYMFIGGVVGLQYCNTLNITDANISMNVDSSNYGDTKVGGFAGCLSGNSNNDTYIARSTHKGDLTGKYVGGISGESSLTNGVIENCYFIGDKIASDLSDGMFGLISNTIDSHFNINNFYIVGIIEGSNNSKKIFNFIDEDNITADIENAYYDKTVYDVEDDSLIGLTTEQMQGYPTYDNMNFDFDNVWKANKEYYPTFVQLNTAPELSGQDIELIQNQEYDLLDYVTIEDFEDKDLIPEIVTDLDITKIGDYTATFTVTDPQGLSDELTLNIKVVMENPIINASDIEIYKGEEFDPRKDVTAIDVDGTDITEHIKVVENTVNTQEVGEYKVVYEISSLYKTTVQKEIKVTVKEKLVIDEEEKPTPSQPDKEEKPVSPKPEGDKDNDKIESSTNNTINNKPQTGDNFMVYGISLIMSLAGLFFINRKNKKC